MVAHARVPILTFETVPELGMLPVYSTASRHDNVFLGPIKVDLSINSPEGVLMLPKIKEYLDTMPALRPLIMTIKDVEVVGR